MLFESSWNFIKKIIWRNKQKQSITEPKADKKCNPILYQVFISLGPLICCFGVGAMMGFSGIFLPQLEEQNAEMPIIDEDITTWIASSPVLSMMFAAPIGGFLMERVGRKLAHIIPSIPGISGWLIMFFAEDIPTLLIGRILTGISCGLFAPITSAYIGEITAPSIRPAVLGCITLNLTLGTFFCHLLGTFYSWKTTTLCCSMIPTLGGILTLFSQETPNWLLRKNRIDDAREAFFKIRGQTGDTKKELEVIMEKYKDGQLQSRSLRDSIKDLSTKPEIFKPLLVVVLYFMSAQFAGINVVTFYAIDVVKMSLGPDFKNSHLIMLSMDLIRVFSSIVACILLKKLKRRHLVVGGGMGCLVCLLTLSISDFLAAVSSSTIISIYSPLSALLGYVFFISISLVPLPWCLAGELLPQEVRGFAGSILCLTSFFAFFIAVKCAPFLFSSLGTGCTYLIFSSSVIFGIVICLAFLPETKNKTLNEIADAYKR